MKSWQVHHDRMSQKMPAAAQFNERLKLIRSVRPKPFAVPLAFQEHERGQFSFFGIHCVNSYAGELSYFSSLNQKYKRNSRVNVPLLLSFKDTFLRWCI